MIITSLLLVNLLFSRPAEKEISQSRYLVLIPPYEFSEEDLRLISDSLGNITTACTDTSLATSDSQMAIKPQRIIYQIDTLEYDWLILIGGVGSLFYADDQRLLPILHHFSRKGIATLGLSTIVLARAGLLKGKQATTIRDKLAIRELLTQSARYVDKPVIQDGNILTARRPNHDFFQKLKMLKKRR